MANIALPASFADSSLEMVGDQFRVAAGLQAGLANPPSSEWWYPPAVAHPDSDEFNGSSLHARWTISRRVTGFPVLVPVGPVDPMSSPAAGTVRVSYNAKPSCISIQPALGLDVAVWRTLTRPTNSQFRARFSMAIPLNVAAVTDVRTAFVLADAITGGYPDISTNHMECCMAYASAPAGVAMSVFSRSGVEGINGNTVTTPSLDVAPFDAEFIITCVSADIRTFVRRGSTLHLMGNRNIGGLGLTCTVLFYCWTGSVAAASNMPFAPIYSLDYIRQRDDLLLV